MDQIQLNGRSGLPSLFWFERTSEHVSSGSWNFEAIRENHCEIRVRDVNETTYSLLTRPSEDPQSFFQDDFECWVRWAMKKKKPKSDHDQQDDDYRKRKRWWSDSTRVRPYRVCQDIGLVLDEPSHYVQSPKIDQFFSRQSDRGKESKTVLPSTCEKNQVKGSNRKCETVSFDCQHHQIIQSNWESSPWRLLDECGSSEWGRWAVATINDLQWVGLMNLSFWSRKPVN